MKFIIFSTLFIIITLTIADEEEQEYQTFNEWHKIYKKEYINDDDSKLIDLACVENKLNFPVNGEKMLKKDLGYIAIGLAYNLCTEDVKEVGKVAITFLLMAIDEIYETKLDCFKQALKEIEPNEKIVENFKENKMTTSSEECKEILGSENFDKFLDEVLGDTSINEKACNHITRNDIKSFAYRMPIMKYGNLTNFDAELDICGEKIYKIQSKGFECKIEKINAMK